MCWSGGRVVVVVVFPFSDCAVRPVLLYSWTGIRATGLDGASCGVKVFIVEEMLAALSRAGSFRSANGSDCESESTIISGGGAVCIELRVVLE